MKYLFSILKQQLPLDYFICGKPADSGNGLAAPAFSSPACAVRTITAIDKFVLMTFKK